MFKIEDKDNRAKRTSFLFVTLFYLPGYDAL